ncbi:hypothetical protein [Methylobacterium sp. Leaf361]|uniref:hypothetical protein n=1 Tax=Methylobacterium sp. Leaf361 TaxID=1736352 RepID=UPI000AC2E93F|nr:hypothetical protein [Methylobacterium sp. Leaf361]
MLIVMHPAPFRVCAVDCPLASLLARPAADIGAASAEAVWMAQFIGRVGSSDYLIRIMEGDRVVEEALASWWRQLTPLELKCLIADLR